MAAKAPPQAFISSYAPRLRTYANSLLTPVIQPTTALAAPLSRTTKRGTTAINYAEDGFEDYDDDDDENRRRPTGLRSLRREEPGQSKLDASEKFGKEATAPVKVQGIWRDWMGKARSSKADLQTYSQAALPLTLIPIRIDVDIPAFVPAPPLPLPTGAAYNSIDPTLPVYRTQETTVPYRLKDIFLWNLHETLTTTDQFAQCMVQDLDLPNKSQIAMEISKQIRTQLEEYAGVALHPLFHSQPAPIAGGPTVKTIKSDRDLSTTPALSGAVTPLQGGRPQSNGFSTPNKPYMNGTSQDITATASRILPESDEYNLDDTYRCIITLNINLSNYLYTDKFEWSLLHPPGTADIFAKQTCADMGLAGEWVPAMTHAIYEAVLRLKKEACESGGLVGNSGYGGDFANDAANGAEAGWRYDPEHLADEWEPKVELLSKEEIEKREGDRERQIRRLRRETARFSSSAGMMGGIPQAGERGFFDAEPLEERMGRGERSKKKRRFRSLSPLGRSGTPGGRGTPDTGGLAGYGGGGGLSEYERSTWRCSQCKVWGSAVWAVRDGPHGPRTLCNNCGFLFERDRKLPSWAKDLHKLDLKATDYR
ncbi:MAG: Chromatin structure remodeling complex protein sfh1 [Claussenomyces sp. TS43310]|nr:MAG: Chromatin structure remodeling complex protein sfh1 [Claussenomyces sp. TS43310]